MAQALPPTNATGCFDIHRKPDGAMPAVNIAGITIRNGMLDGNPAYGGGIQAHANLTLSNTAILSNTAGTGGGGVGLLEGTLTIQHSRIAHNNGGGVQFLVNWDGIDLTQGILLIDQSLIEYNQGSYGGGIQITGGSATIRRNPIAHNRAPNGGGGIDTSEWASLVTIADSVIYANEGWNGGGANIYSDAVITGSRIEANLATGRRGGGVYVGGTLAMTWTQVISNATSVANGISTSGGGLWVMGATRIVDSEFYSNTAPSAPGKWRWRGALG